MAKGSSGAYTLAPTTRDGVCITFIAASADDTFTITTPTAIMYSASFNAPGSLMTVQTTSAGMVFSACSHGGKWYFSLVPFDTTLTAP
jgi:hypothetical protein